MAKIWILTQFNRFEQELKSLTIIPSSQLKIIQLHLEMCTVIHYFVTRILSYSHAANMANRKCMAFQKYIVRRESTEKIFESLTMDEKAQVKELRKEMTI